jgi:hypothetical protein
METATQTYHRQANLNPAQISFLQGIRYIQTEEDARELKEIISNYYFNKLQKEVDKYQIDDSILNEHLRTPYK